MLYIKYRYYLILTAIGIIFFIINILTPMHSDDWFYAHITNSSQRLEDISDLFYSQYIHYFEMNGRFIPHFILQFFIGFTNKFTFSLANTFIFCLFLHLINIIATDNQKKYFFYTTLINLTLICIFLPAFKYVFIWQTGACNYLWSATLLLSFHIFIMREHNRSVSIFVIPLLLLYGIICGWTHEGLVIGLLSGYSYYFIIHKKGIMRFQLYLLIGFIIGACFLILSPAALNRAFLSTNEQSISFLTQLKSYTIAFISFHNLRLFFILILYIFIMKRKISINNDKKNNTVFFFIALITTFLFVWFTKHDGNRSRFGIELYSLVILLIIVPKHKISKHIFTLSYFIVLLTLSSILIHFSLINHKESQYLTQQIKNSTSKEIIINYTNEKNYPPFIQRFIIRGFLPDNIEYYNAFNPNSFENQLLSLYFKKEKIYILPKTFINQINSLNEFIDSFDVETDFPFYFKNTTDTDKNQKFKYILEPSKHIPIYHRPFASLMQRYSCQELQVDNQTILKHNNYSYILIGKNKMIGNRVSNIVPE